VSGPERRFRDSVHKHLLENIYRQGMGGVSTSGTPDSYYEAPTGHTLWVEWKATPSARPRLIPDPTPLQKHWLRRAHGNRQRVAVICGYPGGGIVLPGLTWESRLVSDAVLIGSRKEIARWIEEVLTLITGE